jgi:hypothetical protein
MEILPKNLPIFQKYEPPNPLSNPGFDAQEQSYQRIPESPGEKLSKNHSLELLSCGSYFSAFFKHKISLLKCHKADFILVFQPPRTCPTTPSKGQPLSYGEKEHFFNQSRVVKGQKIKIITTSEAGHSLSPTSENCNYVVASMGQTPAQVPLEDLSDQTSRSWIPNTDSEYHSVQKSDQKAGKQTLTTTNTLPELPDGESLKVAKKLRKKPLNGEMSDKTSGNDVNTKKSTTTNNSLCKRARKFKHQNKNNNINTNNITLNVYQYKIIYMTLTLRPMTSESNMESQKDPDIAKINCAKPFPSSNLRLTSGLALRSTLRTLTLRPMTSETNREPHKDPDIAEINCVQPTSTSRLTSGLALRSTLRLTMTLSGNNNINVYQYKTIYMTLTLRPMTSETNMESHKDPNIEKINCVKQIPSSTSKLTSGLALRLTLRLTMNSTFTSHAIPSGVKHHLLVKKPQNSQEIKNK